MPSTQQCQPTRVLVVEDEGIVAADIEASLKDGGYDVTGIADNGADALALATADPPDLALVDIRLRGSMDGIELAQHLRDELLVPVVFATAHADAATVRRARATEPFGYIVKPFDQQALQIAIEVATSRHAAEEKIRQLVRWFETTLQSMGHAVLATDRFGRINLINAEAVTLTGWPRKEALGRPIFDLFKLSSAQAGTPATNLLTQVLERGMVLQVNEEVWLHTKQEKRVPIDYSLAPVRDDDGLIMGLVAVFCDRSSLVAAQEERRRRDLQLHEAQRIESLGVLAGGLAHDFNNLLAIIDGNAVLGSKELAPQSELRRYLGNIMHAARRGADLCTQMLACAGRGPMRRRQIDLNALIRDSLRLVEISVSRRAEITLELADTLPSVVGDPGKLQHVIMNLVNNASEALGDRHGIITLRTRSGALSIEMARALEPVAERAAGNYVMLEVQDTGEGMTEEARRRVFDPFFTSRFEGRGLGLAAVRGIVGAHDGGVTVESELGVGTVFRVFLPVSESAQHDAV